MKIPHLLLLTCLLSACFSDQKEKLVYTDFPEVIELKGTIIEIDTALFRYPFRISVEGERALVLDLHNADYYYHLFSYPGFDYLSSFGKCGEAPGEMLSAETMSMLSDKIIALDANKRELTTIF